MKKLCNQAIAEFFVRLKGLEPPRLSAPDPKSGAATNYATAAWCALRVQRYLKVLILQIKRSENIMFSDLEIGFDIDLLQNRADYFFSR